MWAAPVCLGPVACALFLWGWVQAVLQGPARSPREQQGRNRAGAGPGAQPVQRRVGGEESGGPLEAVASELADLWGSAPSCVRGRQESCGLTWRWAPGTG